MVELSGSTHWKLMLGKVDPVPATVCSVSDPDIRNIAFAVVVYRRVSPMLAV